jgi:ferrous iron transport protein A
MSLAEVRPARRVRVVALKGGRSVLCRLGALGVLPGAEFRVLSGQLGGPLVLARDGCRLAVGCGMVEKVMVEVLGSGKGGG